MNVSIVKHTDTGEVKLFSGGDLIGRYKSENDALAHLSTALVELTAAQQRVAELEAALKSSVTLQSHYAELLNMHDGGRRMTFDSMDSWLQRLRDVANGKS